MKKTVPTALQNTCVLRTRSPLINEAFRFAKDNIARCIRPYSLGWGMGNCPHGSTIVVGRDTGWMCLGTDYVAPWFAPAALGVFRDRQKANGQILEYVDLESGATDDYGLNVADNTPLYLWGICHHWRQHGDDLFRQSFLPSVRRAGDHLLSEMRPNGLLSAVPAGTGVRGISCWRNMIEGYVLAGEVTEINCLSAMALRMVHEMTGEAKYAEKACQLARSINCELWEDERGHYLLTRHDGVRNRQLTGDNVFAMFTGVADDDRSRRILRRLEQEDFLTERGLRTLPKSDPLYHPSAHFGLVGGVWPNLTLWYAAACARFDADRALDVLERVARPIVESGDSNHNIRHSEFPEWFDGDTGVNGGMHLSPWVAPTFIWAVMEGLLGAQWSNGNVTFKPNWPKGWRDVSLSNLPVAGGSRDFVLERDEAGGMSTCVSR